MRIDVRGSRSWPRLLVALAGAMALALPGGTALAAPPSAPTPPATAQRATPDRAGAAQAAAERAATRAASRAADAAQRDQAVWETHGRPAALVVVRLTSIDLVDQGRTTQRIPRAGADLPVATLARFLPRNWLTITGGTARLAAAVVVTPGVTLDVSAPVTTLQLVGGPTQADAASLWTGGGALTLRGVTVSSVDRTSGAAMAAGPGRPFVLASPGGRLTATDSTLSDLGSAPSDAADGPTQDHPGVDFRAGSTGTLVRTSVLRNGTGLTLDGSQGVHLEDVTISGSAGMGLVLHGDKGTTMSGVRAEHNGTDGVRVTGPSTDRAVTGISTTGNRAFGISVDKQTGLHMSGITAVADGTGGVDVQQSGAVTITGLTATDEPIGVFTHVNSTKVVLDRLTSTGGRRAVMIEKTTDGLTLQASTITGASVAGVSVGGRNVELRDTSVAGSRNGVRVERGAHGVTAAGLTLAGGMDGVVTSPDTDGVVLQDLKVDGVSDDGVRSSSPGTRIVGGRITGGATGIAVDAPTTISGTAIGQVDEGIRTQSPGLVHADQVDVNAASVGINAAAGSPVLLTGSRVHALESVRGTLTAEGVNDLSLPPLNLLGAVGVPLVLLAVALQVVAALRGRRFGGDVRRAPPTAVPPVPTAVPAVPATAAAETRPVSGSGVGRKTPAHA